MDLIQFFQQLYQQVVEVLEVDTLTQMVVILGVQEEEHLIIVILLLLAEQVIHLLLVLHKEILVVTYMAEVVEEQ